MQRPLAAGVCGFRVFKQLSYGSEKPIINISKNGKLSIKTSSKTDKYARDYLTLFGGDFSAALSALESQRYVTVNTPNEEFSISQKEVVISVSNITKKYKLAKQTVTAISGVSLNIHKGEIVAITGPSGSGKSTLLQIIGCLDKPTSGKILIGDNDTTTLSDMKLSELRKNTIGFIFQSFYLQPFLRVNDNVAVPAMFTKAAKSLIDEKVKNLLEQVGIVDQSNHLPKELSGGQIQRAAIARALINSPSIILADEPTGNLDSTNSRSILTLFKKIRDELGTTIVIVTHNPDIVSQADRIIEMRDGVIV